MIGIINYFKASNSLFLPLFVSNILLISTPSLFKNLSSLFVFILTITFFSSEIVDFGTINNDVLL